MLVHFAGWGATQIACHGLTQPIPARLPAAVNTQEGNDGWRIPAAVLVRKSEVGLNC